MAAATAATATGRGAPAPSPALATPTNATAPVAPWPRPAPGIVSAWPEPVPPVAADPAAVAAAETLLGFGPLADAQRRQLYGEGLPYLPSTVGTLVESYARVRAAVASSPEGGDRPPLALVYAPPVFESKAAKQKATKGQHSGGVVAASMAPPDAVDSIPPGPGDTADDAATHAPGDMQLGVGERLAATAGDVLRWGGAACGKGDDAGRAPARPATPARPSDDDLAFMSALELGALVKARVVTSVELVELFTKRMKSLDPYLEAVVTLTTDLALTQARRADADAAAGRSRGPLAGVPYGLKDVIAVAGYPTTWGLKDHVNRTIPTSAAVYDALTAAGAVLVAKLASGELAFDDVWYGGHVKNPWNLAQGASGSSGGPAAAVAAGLVPFALGTETQGSLVSPAARCGVTAVRPTPGVVPRGGVMIVADTLDKVGPVCRAATDCAVVLDVLRGGSDDAAVSAADPAYRRARLAAPSRVDLASLTVAVLPGASESVQPVVDALKARGVKVVQRTLTYAVPAADVATTILLAEGSSSFDHWVRSGAASRALRQDFWPPLFRLGRLIPAPEYVSAQRARGLLAAELAAWFVEGGHIDAVIGRGTDLLAAANLVGLASVAAPLALGPARDAPAGSPRRAPTSVGFFAPPYADGVALALASAWQDASDVHLARPPVDRIEADVRDACAPRSRCRLSAAELVELRLGVLGGNEGHGGGNEGRTATAPPSAR